MREREFDQLKYMQKGKELEQEREKENALTTKQEQINVITKWYDDLFNQAKSEMRRARSNKAAVKDRLPAVVIIVIVSVIVAVVTALLLLLIAVNCYRKDMIQLHRSPERSSAVVFAILCRI